ncbi:unnamed protein product [Clonostachys solani]|uniref:Uncharacterized protein n=1 Tax=Clonostachys solani TaxID=160281 RepID=A0A9N9WA25_9HYPO|nr:unnamed protein product [Clonostachys solani]
MPKRSSAAATPGGGGPSQRKTVTTPGSRSDTLAHDQLLVPSKMVEVRRPWGHQPNPLQPSVPSAADQNSGSQMLNAWLLQDTAEDPFHAIAALVVGTGTATTSKSTAISQTADSLSVNRSEQEGTVATCGSWTEGDG